MEGLWLWLWSWTSANNGEKAMSRVCMKSRPRLERQLGNLGELNRSPRRGDTTGAMRLSLQAAFSRNQPAPPIAACNSPCEHVQACPQ
jgi:hypothetical protein